MRLTFLILAYASSDERIGIFNALFPPRLQQPFLEHMEAGSGHVVLIPAYLHDVADYVNASVQHGFELIRMEEWRDAQETTNTMPPRLLSLRVRVPYRHP